MAILSEGDPFFYGSYMYLHNRLADRYDTTVVPGISSPVAGSAALSRQANAERFAEDFAGAHPISTGVVRDWLASDGITLISDRSDVSQVKVGLNYRFTPATAVLARY